MRIKQLYSNFSPKFKKDALEKFKLEDATENINHKEPLIIIGCYNVVNLGVADLNSRNSGLTVIYWAGTDAKRFAQPQNCFWAKRFRENTNIKHIASSKWIADDLDSVGIPYRYLPITLADNSNITPEAPGDSVYMYKPMDPYYNGGIYDKLKELLPYKFIESRHDTYSDEEILEVYKNSFVGLRFTNHDGLSETVAKMGLMGRMVIHNDVMPNCIPYDLNNLEGIINDIHNEFKASSGNSYKQVAKEMKSYLDVNDDWLNTEFYD